jgi:hypothetical protein
LQDHLTFDAIGFVAAGLVLTTFCMRSMSALRWVAIASNLAFIAYGYLGTLPPVLVLHALLLPVNTYRLTQLSWAGRSGNGRAERPASCAVPHLDTDNSYAVHAAASRTADEILMSEEVRDAHHAFRMQAGTRRS